MPRKIRPLKMFWPLNVTGFDVIHSCSFPAATIVPPTVIAPSMTSNPIAAIFARLGSSPDARSVWYSATPTSVAASALRVREMAIRCGIAVIGTHMPMG